MYEMGDDTNVGHFVWKNYLNRNNVCITFCFDFYIHSKCNVLVIESLINYIPNQDDIETENCTNTNVAKNGY